MELELTEGGGSHFDKTKGDNGTIVVDTAQPDALGDFANEAHHARQHLEGTSSIDTASARRSSREQYVKSAVAEEAESEIHQQTVERELAGKPALSGAEKEQIASDYASGNIKTEGGQTYADYHGASWDRVQSDPDAEALPPAASSGWGPIDDWAKAAGKALWNGVRVVGGAIVNGAEALGHLAGDGLEFAKGVIEGVKQQGLDLWSDARKLGQVGTDFAKAVARGDLQGAIAPFKKAFDDAVSEIRNLGPNAVKAFDSIKNTLLNGSAREKGILLGGVLGVGARGGGGGAAGLTRGVVGFIKRRAGFRDEDHDKFDASGRQTKELSHRHQTVEQARNAALREVGDLGYNKRPTYAKDMSKAAGKIHGWESADGKRGFRVDFDPQKGIHYNWYDYTNGKKGQGGRWGAESFPGTEADYLKLINQMNNR